MYLGPLTPTLRQLCPSTPMKSRCTTRFPKVNSTPSPAAPSPPQHHRPRSTIAASNATGRLPQTQALRNGDRRLSDPAGCRIIWRQGGTGGGGVECKAFVGSSRRGSGTQWFENIGAAAYRRAGAVGCGGVYCLHQADHSGARQNLTRTRLLNLVFFTCTFLQCFFHFKTGRRCRATCSQSHCASPCSCGTASRATLCPS